MKAFFGWMIAASAVGFAKMITLAAILSPAAFGNYAVAVGGASLLTMAVSFGLIEGTIKRFPRLWVEGKGSEIRADMHIIARRTMLRSGGLGTACLLLAFVGGRSDLLLPVALGVALGGIGLLTRLESAAILATGDSPALIALTVGRALFAIILSVGGGLAWSWTGALAGEVAGAALTVAQGARLSRRLLGDGRDGSVEAVTSDSRLYISAVLVASTQMADRGLVNIAAGASVAGAYGFVMLLPQAGQVLINVISQRFGPRLIRSQRQHGRLELRPLVLTGLIAIAGTVVFTVAALLAAHLFPYMTDKYQIDAATIVLAGLLSLMFYYVILEYALISIDREGAVLASSVVTSAVFVCSYAASSTLKEFLLAALVTRSVQLVWLLAALALPTFRVQRR